MNDETRNDIRDLLTGAGGTVQHILGRKMQRSMEKALTSQNKKKKGCMGCGCVVPIFIGFFVIVYLL